MDQLEDKIQQAARAIIAADGLIIGAGAGMGIDSGLPDFRGRHGFWKAYPALESEDLEFTEIANPLAFERQPQLAWGFYGHRFQLYQSSQPHKGFSILKRIGEQLESGYQVFTSNVDGQFQKAGFKSQQILECHGSINHLQCLAPCSQDIWKCEHHKFEIDVGNCRASNPLPECRHCGGLARPNILMFGDYSWISHRTDQQAAKLQRSLEKMKRPVVIECGAGTAVPSVRYFCERQSAVLIRINPYEFQATGLNAIELPLGALEALETIEHALLKMKFYN